MNFEIKIFVMKKKLHRNIGEKNDFETLLGVITWKQNARKY